MKEGRKAPAFKLPDQDGNTVSLGLRRPGRWCSISTPRPARRAARRRPALFASGLNKFEAAGRPWCWASLAPTAQVPRQFTDKFGLPFVLLADEDHAVAEKYGVWVEKSMYGRKYMGIERSTFVIGPDGKVKAAFRRSRPRSTTSWCSRRSPRLVAPPPGRHLGVLVVGVRRADRKDLGALGARPRSCASSRRGTRTASHVFSSTTSSSSFIRALPLTIT